MVIISPPKRFGSINILSRSEWFVKPLCALRQSFHKIVYIGANCRSHSLRSGQALRQAQDRPFDKLRTGPSTSSGQALRQAQDRPFDKLRVNPSNRPFDRLSINPSEYPESCKEN
jgi:hypothetical protein